MLSVFIGGSGFSPWSLGADGMLPSWEVSPLSDGELWAPGLNCDWSFRDVVQIFERTTVGMIALAVSRC
jgi:hypothetical protein